MHLAVTETYDAIVLDIMLPGLDGMEVCRRIRQDAHVSTPVIMLTARDQLTDKLDGFGVGADDYLVKPFDLPELEARIEAVVRRARGLAVEYTIDDLILNAETMLVSRAGKELKLTKRLFDILRVLMRESPKVVTREQLERELWGDEPPDSDSLRSHLYNLRQIVDKPFDIPLIETLTGRGYCVKSRSAVDR
jgi:DNA-binding response OmpR family regulator